MAEERIEQFFCPEYLEIEELIGTINLMVRIQRAFAEREANRTFDNRGQFVSWVEANRTAVVRTATIKSLSHPLRPLGWDGFETLEVDDRLER